MKLNDCMLHLGKDVDSAGFRRAEERVRSLPGVVSAGRSPHRKEVLMVAYDPSKSSIKSLVEAASVGAARAKAIAM